MLRATSPQDLHATEVVGGRISRRGSGPTETLSLAPPLTNMPAPPLPSPHAVGGDADEIALNEVSVRGFVGNADTEAGVERPRDDVEEFAARPPTTLPGAELR
ncbi:MAG: hypothetical protein IPF53_15830 [Blastocatellia bacterium]|nr:hypothetical protein [Blastocatellia bacterium]